MRARRILVVEDEKKLAEYLRKGLSENGYVVDVANDGIEARHLAVNGEYDLLILDVMLPGIYGFDVMKADRQANGVPFLMLTARDKVETGSRGSRRAPTTTSSSRSRFPSCWRVFMPC
jgi:two-component system copper resistance phosphate regulon response regulator CusR